MDFAHARGQLLATRRGPEDARCPSQNPLPGLPPPARAVLVREIQLEDGMQVCHDGRDFPRQGIDRGLDAAESITEQAEGGRVMPAYFPLGRGRERRPGAGAELVGLPQGGKRDHQVSDTRDVVGSWEDRDPDGVHELVQSALVRVGEHQPLEEHLVLARESKGGRGRRSRGPVSFAFQATLTSGGWK